MHLADTLSRAYLPTGAVSDFVHLLEAVDHTEDLPVSHERLQEIRQASANDATLSRLATVIRNGWPDAKSKVEACLHPYYDIRSDLTEQDALIFKGHQLVIPASLRKELMEVTHYSHMGIEGCLRRMRECLYWPRMSTDMRQYISHCDTCLSHRDAQSKEPLKPHNIPARPWAKVGADLCEMNGRTLLVVVDYFSDYIEVERLASTTTQAILKPLRSMFARHGIPDTIVSDNGPQFGSGHFAAFCKKWDIGHVTSSPTYAQSNGKAESAVKIIKRMFQKCKDTGESDFIALLDYRNTPTEKPCTTSDGSPLQDIASDDHSPSSASFLNGRRLQRSHRKKRETAVLLWSYGTSATTPTPRGLCAHTSAWSDHVVPRHLPRWSRTPILRSSCGQCCLQEESARHTLDLRANSSLLSPG